jgi:hypothetical protein
VTFAEDARDFLLMHISHKGHDSNVLQLGRQYLLPERELRRPRFLLLSSYLLSPASSVSLHGMAGYTERRKTQKVMMNVPAAAIGRMS